MGALDRQAPDPALQALTDVAVADRREAIDRALDAARELLGMDIAYLSELAGDTQLIKHVRGERDAVEFLLGAAFPLQESYCGRMLAGELRNVVNDAQNDPRVNDLAITARSGVGCYVGVPLQLSDGRVYGTLCCASGEPNERLGPRDAQFMRVLARLVADDLEREQERLPRPRKAGAPRGSPDDAAREAVQTEVRDAILKLDLWLVAAAHAAAAARRALEVLAEHVERNCLQDARLLLSELVTNSVRHAGVGGESSIGLALRLTPDRLSVAVSDPGPGFVPEITAPGIDQEGGRGLFIVDQLADRWGVGDSPFTPPRGARSDGPGTVVWFEIRRSSTEPALA